MKKLVIIATAGLLASAAFARSGESYIAEICALKAEHAVKVANLARQGYPWEDLEKSLTHNGAKKDLDLTHLRTAYYQYSTLDPQSIRALTFSECKLQYLKDQMRK